MGKLNRNRNLSFQFFFFILVKKYCFCLWSVRNDKEETISSHSQAKKRKFLLFSHHFPIWQSSAIVESVEWWVSTAEKKKIFVWHFWSERKKFWDASYQEGNKTEAFTRLDSDEPVKKTLLILEMKTSELRETGHLYKCVHCHPWNTKEKSLHTKREEQLDW